MATSTTTKAYFAGGEGDSGNLIDYYDGTTGTWTYDNFYNGSLSQQRLNGAATSIGNKAIFAAGIGSFSLSVQNGVDIYDESTNKWTTATVTQARQSICAVSIGTRAFFAGGCDRYEANFYSVVDIYDDSTGLWSTAELSSARLVSACATAGNVALFAGSSFVSNVLDLYDNNRNVWSTGRLSIARTSFCGAESGNLILFGPGIVTSGFTNAVDLWTAPGGSVIPTSPVAPNLQTQQPVGSGLSGGAVAGIIIAVLFIVICIVGIAAFIFFKMSKDSERV